MLLAYNILVWNIYTSAFDIGDGTVNEDTKKCYTQTRAHPSLAHSIEVWNCKKTHSETGICNELLGA